MLLPHHVKGKDTSPLWNQIVPYQPAEVIYSKLFQSFYLFTVVIKMCLMLEGNIVKSPCFSRSQLANSSGPT